MKPVTRTESYAAVWREPGGARAVGRAVLEPTALRLQGATRGGHVSSHEVPYAELEGVRIGRAPGELLDGRPTLVLDRSPGPPLCVGVLGIGTLSELADLLSQLVEEQPRQTERLVVIVPLKEGAVERARALIEDGPPFDPEETAFERHEVFVGAREVVFLFEGREIGGIVQRLVRDPGTWRAALAWRGLLAGPPRLARAAYSWTRASSRT